MKKGTTNYKCPFWLNKRCTAQSTLCVGNKKGKTELKAMCDRYLKKKKKKLVKKAGRHFGFFKRAGRRALQKKPRQNTVYIVYLGQINEILILICFS